MISYILHIHTYYVCVYIYIYIYNIHIYTHVVVNGFLVITNGSQDSLGLARRAEITGATAQNRCRLRRHDKTTDCGDTCSYHDFLDTLLCRVWRMPHRVPHPATPEWSPRRGEMAAVTPSGEQKPCWQIYAHGLHGYAGASARVAPLRKCH